MLEKCVPDEPSLSGIEKEPSQNTARIVPLAYQRKDM